MPTSGSLLNLFVCLHLVSCGDVMDLKPATNKPLSQSVIGHDVPPVDRLYVQEGPVHITSVWTNSQSSCLVRWHIFVSVCSNSVHLVIHKAVGLSLSWFRNFKNKSYDNNHNVSPKLTVFWPLCSQQMSTGLTKERYLFFLSDLIIIAKRK